MPLLSDATKSTQPWTMITSRHSGCHGRFACPSLLSPKPCPGVAWTTVPANYHLLYPVDSALTESRSPSTSCGSVSSSVGRKRLEKTHETGCIWGPITLAICQIRWDPQKSLMRVECVTTFVIPGLPGQLKSKTAVDFIDCSTNHVSKHSCNPFQNMPSLTHSCFLQENAEPLLMLLIKILVILKACDLHSYFLIRLPSALEVFISQKHLKIQIWLLPFPHPINGMRLVSSSALLIGWKACDSVHSCH